MIRPSRMDIACPFTGSSRKDKSAVWMVSIECTLRGNDFFRFGMKMRDIWGNRRVRALWNRWFCLVKGVSLLKGQVFTQVRMDHGHGCGALQVRSRSIDWTHAAKRLVQLVRNLGKRVECMRCSKSQCRKKQKKEGWTCQTEANLEL